MWTSLGGCYSAYHILVLADTQKAISFSMFLYLGALCQTLLFVFIFLLFSNNFIFVFQFIFLDLLVVASFVPFLPGIYSSFFFSSLSALSRIS